MIRVNGAFFYRYDDEDFDRWDTSSYTSESEMILTEQSSGYTVTSAPLHTYPEETQASVYMLLFS